VINLQNRTRPILQKGQLVKLVKGVFSAFVILINDTLQAYAASAWRGFTTSDRQHINSVIDRARRLGYCSPDTPTFDELCDTSGDELFSKAVRLSNHVLHVLPPSSTASQRQCLF